MKTLTLKTEEFEELIKIIRLDVVKYMEMVNLFDSFKPIDNCYLAIQMSCCARKSVVKNDCFNIFKTFLLGEKSKEFFSFFKNNYGYTHVIITENGVIFSYF